MAIQSQFYTLDGSTNKFSSSKHIGSKSKVAVWLKLVLNGSFEQLDPTTFDLINNFVVLDDIPDTIVYSELEVRVADVASELTQVPSDISIVAGDIANINAVAAIETSVVKVGNIDTSVSTVAANDANVTKVANIDTDVTKVALVDAQVVSVATDVDKGLGTNLPTDSAILNALNNATIATDQATIATTKASETSTSATNSETSYQNSLASANASEISRQASDASLYDFKGRYFQALASAPTVDLNGNPIDAGDMYFDTTLNEIRVYDGVVWKSAGSTVNGTSQRQSFIATAGQTTFTISGGYDATFADVYLNGTKLVNGTDVDISSGTDIVLTVGAVAGDNVDVVAYGAFEIANTYTKGEIDASLTAEVNDSLHTISSGKANPAYTKVEIDSGYATKTLSTTADLDVLNKVKNVDGAGSGLDADTVDGVQGALLGIGGQGYSWVDETANKVSDTTYTNTTGKPIIIKVGSTVGTDTSQNFSFDISVDGVRHGFNSQLYGSNTGIVDISIVPNGATYKVNAVRCSVYKWFELK
jgi:hypothetical protein